MRPGLELLPGGAPAAAQMVQFPHRGCLKRCVDQSEGGPEGGPVISVPPAMDVRKGDALQPGKQRPDEAACCLRRTLYEAQERSQLTELWLETLPSGHVSKPLRQGVVLGTHMPVTNGSARTASS